MPSSTTRLPYLAPPRWYFGEREHELESALIDRSWQPLEPGIPSSVALGDTRWAKRVASDAQIESELAPETIALARRAFSTDWRLASFFSLAHPCNWKVPLENVLESYHVDCLHDNVVARHPKLFRVFAGGPEKHDLGEGHSSYFDTFGDGSSVLRRVLGLVHPEATTAYVHHHVMPNIVLATTGLFSFMQQVVPTSPRTSRSNVWLYVRARAHAIPGMSRLAAAAIRRVLDEDAAVYDAVQRGLESSSRTGVIGTREERIWHFHRWLAQHHAPAG